MRLIHIFLKFYVVQILKVITIFFKVYVNFKVYVRVREVIYSTLRVETRRS